MQGTYFALLVSSIVAPQKYFYGNGWSREGEGGEGGEVEIDTMFIAIVFGCYSWGVIDSTIDYRNGGSIEFVINGVSRKTTGIYITDRRYVLCVLPQRSESTMSVINYFKTK